MAEKISFNADIVRQLAELLTQTDLTEIEYESGDQRIRVARQSSSLPLVHNIPPAAFSASPAPAVAVSEIIPVSVQPPLTQHKGAVKSPMVGTAYLSPEPGAPPFVKEGDMVTEGQTLLIIEAMKVMNPIRSPQAGKISRIFIKEAAPVEFDEILLVIES